jgi:Flp pilus assembly protein TadG
MTARGSMISRFRPRRRTDDGASAVEIALVIPILLALVFGIISFGALFAQQLALNNGVRQGARLAVVEGSTANQSCASVVTAVRDSSGPAIAMNTDDIDVNVARTAATPCGTSDNPASSTVVCNNSIDGTTNAQESIVVTAKYQADLLIPMPIPGFPSQFDLESKAVYKCEFS